jgi:RNA polymerase sigma-70 factor (ECF subfamily)
MRAEAAKAPPIYYDSDEAALVERAKERSREAWTVIYDRHFQAIYRYVHARVFDYDAASDVTANVFVAAINGIGSYRYTGRPMLAWLYVIARNAVADHQRQILRTPGTARSGSPLQAVKRFFSGEEHGTPPDVYSPGPWEPDVMAERLDLHRAISDLPESQREVLILRFLVGLSTQEISRVVGKERAAVYSLHARAIASLRRSMGVEEG